MTGVGGQRRGIRRLRIERKGWSLWSRTEEEAFTVVRGSWHPRNMHRGGLLRILQEPQGQRLERNWKGVVPRLQGGISWWGGRGFLKDSIPGRFCFLREIYRVC